MILQVDLLFPLLQHLLEEIHIHLLRNTITPQQMVVTTTYRFNEVIYERE